MKKRARYALDALEPRRLLAADLEGLLGRVPAAAYSVDGTGNNLANPSWGAVNTDLTRGVVSAYADGLSAPSGASRPSAREISNVLADSEGRDIISDRFLSAMVYAWGQFLDHDLSLTNAARPVEELPIEVPRGDPSFDPSGTGTQTIPLERSEFDPTTGQSSPREQVNELTAWVDGSMIYGTDPATAAALRAFQGGRLKLDAEGMLPRNDPESFPDGVVPMVNVNPLVPDPSLFAAGDVRANENIELTALHALFAREHNYWANRFAEDDHSLSDEALYQRARAMVIAEIQSITYTDWLPALMGPRAMGAYRGYDPAVNPGIANEFSTAAFRFGHSLLGDDVAFLDDQGRPVREEVALSEAFGNPDLLASTGIDPVLKYLASDPASELDPMVVASVRDFLFGPPGAGGLDLASLNIQRGRDHGLADYNSTRVAYGLPAVTSFGQITSDPEVASKLEQLYVTVDDIDLWVGGLAEDHLPGGSLGPTFQAIIKDQFTRLREGDRFFYRNVMSEALAREIDRTSLSDIIRRNTDLTNLQADPFFFRAAVTGRVFADANRDGRSDRREPGLAGRTIELVDASTGELIDQAITDAQGGYRFDVQDGLRTGSYQVRLNVPAGSRATTPTALNFDVTRGEVVVGRLDFGESSGRTRPAPVTPGARPRSLPRRGLAIAANQAAMEGAMLWGASATTPTKAPRGPRFPRA